MRLDDIQFFIKEALWAIRLNLMSNLMSMMSIALCLLILGFLMVGVWNLEHLVNIVRSEAEITVYLKDSLTDNQVQSVSSAIASRPGVVSVHLVSKEQALAKMQELLDSEAGLLQAFDGFNPFASFSEVRVVPEQAAQVAEAAASLPGVERVRDNKEVLSRLVSLTWAVKWVGAVVTIAVGVVVMVVISNIVRLGIYSRREEIEIIKLLGASEWFVATPFILEGAIIGGLGGLISILTLLGLYPGLYALLHRSLPFVPFIHWSATLKPLSLIVVALGICFGGLGSTFSVRPLVRSTP